MINKEDIIQACERVLDPEIGIDIYTIGLIYNITITDNVVDILMTYTTPLCPYGGRIKDEIIKEISILNPDKVNIEVTFEPKWEISDELRALLGV